MSFSMINLLVSESFLRLVTRAVKRRLKAGFIVRRAHAAAAAAGGRFDHYRITDFLCDLDRVAFRLDNSIASRRHRHAGFPRASARRVLVAHGLHRTLKRAR